jgi:hypothetical protein
MEIGAVETADARFTRTAEGGEGARKRNSRRGTPTLSSPSAREANGKSSHPRLRISSEVDGPPQNEREGDARVAPNLALSPKSWSDLRRR